MSKKDRVLERVNRCVSHCSELTAEILGGVDSTKAAWYLVAPRSQDKIVEHVLEQFRREVNFEAIFEHLKNRYFGGDVFLSREPNDLRGSLIILMRHGEKEVSYYDYERNDALLIHCDVLD